VTVGVGVVANVDRHHHIFGNHPAHDLEELGRVHPTKRVQKLGAAGLLGAPASFAIGDVLQYLGTVPGGELLG